MKPRESPLVVVAKGAAAGLAGTAALSAAMAIGATVLPMLGFGSGKPTTPAGDEEPTEKLAREVATGVLETPIDRETKQVAGQAIHWGYGTAWGVVYGLGQSTLRLPHMLHGTVFGLLVATVASTVVPALRLAPPPTEQTRALSAAQMIYHLIYGWVTALTFDALSHDA